MMPITFMDCRVVHRYFLGKGNSTDDRVYDELFEGEVQPKDEDDNEAEIEDEKDEDVKKEVSVSKKTKASPDDFLTLKRLIQGTWDSGKSAKYDPLMKAINSTNVDTKTDSE